MQNYSSENCYNVEDPSFIWSHCNHYFQQVGLHYARPIFYKNTKPESFSCYVLLFIYPFTRTAHLEITLNVRSYSLKIESHKFFSWMGVRKIMISDNFQTLNWKNFYGICHTGIYISAMPLVGRLLWTPCGHKMFEKAKRKIKSWPTIKLKYLQLKKKVLLIQNHCLMLMIILIAALNFRSNRNVMMF